MGGATKTNSFINMVRYSGIYIGAVIGAGFASGQEPLQFFVGHGYWGIIGVVIAIGLFAWYGSLFMELGNKLKTSSHKNVLTYLCGKYVGNVFDWILTFFLFGVFAIMISGGGSALHQYFGVDLFAGKIIIAIAALVTVFLGFSSALNTLGFLSPLIIITTVVLSIYTIFTNFSGIATAGDAINELDLSTASPNWLMSALIYVSYCVLPTLPALASVGNTEPDVRVVRKSGIIGGLALGIACLFMVIALFSNVSKVAQYEIPFLEVARLIHPAIGIVFAFILLSAIYTTAVPILFGFSSRFAKPGTNKFKVLTVFVTVAAFIAGIFPFSTLVGTIYPLLGYIGLVVMACGVYRVFVKKDFNSDMK